MFKFIKKLFSRRPISEEPINHIDGLVLPLPDDPRWERGCNAWMSNTSRFILGPIAIHSSYQYLQSNKKVYEYHLYVNREKISNNYRYCDHVRTHIEVMEHLAWQTQKLINIENAKKALKEFNKQKETPCD